MRKNGFVVWALIYVLCVLSIVAIVLLVPKPTIAQNGGRGMPAYGYTEINSGVTGTPVSTQLKTGQGVLHTIVVTNAGSSWTMQVFDNTACSGTAISGATAVTVPAAGSTMIFDAGFKTGLCIKTTGTTAGSMTIDFL